MATRMGEPMVLNERAARLSQAYLRDPFVAPGLESLRQSR
jgi:hypothetical protein